MVWEEALSKLAPKLGLSDVGLRKICKRHNIPLPPQGYWARSPERRSPKRTPLPQPDKDWDLEFSIPLQATPEGQNELDEKFGPQIAAESLPENQIAVVPNQEPRHLMTKAAAKRLEKARADQFGGITCAIPAAFRVRCRESRLIARSVSSMRSPQRSTCVVSPLRKEQKTARPKSGSAANCFALALRKP